MTINSHSNLDRDPGYDLALVLRLLDNEAMEAFWRILVDAEMEGEAKAQEKDLPGAINVLPAAEPQPSPARKPRKPNIATIIRHAKKAGRPVTSITTPDGVTLTFAELAKADNNSATENEVEEWLRKHMHAH
jgi:hypothetical protein